MDVDEIYDEVVNPTEDKEKTASVDSLAEELRKTASKLKEAAPEDTEDSALGEKMQITSDSPEKQRLKEIAMQALKSDMESEAFEKLMQRYTAEADGTEEEEIEMSKEAQLIEELSDEIVQEILG